MSVKIPDLKEMFLTGMHFGHKKERSHPRSKDYVFGLRDGVNVIDLGKTQDMLKSVLEFITREVSQGKVFLFVGTKKQIKDVVKEAAEKCDMPYATHRWLGGTLTNFETIKNGIRSLESTEAKLADPDADMTKKEKTLLDKDLQKLKETYQGIRNMKKLPDVMFIVDVVKEGSAVSEAKKKQIPVVGVCDTDADPRLVDWVIPANDDAKNSVDMIMKLVVEAVQEGKSANRRSADSGNNTKKSVVKEEQVLSELDSVEEIKEEDDKEEK